MSWGVHRAIAKPDASDRGITNGKDILIGDVTVFLPLDFT
jgi:hypothetical protein